MSSNDINIKLIYNLSLNDVKDYIQHIKNIIENLKYIKKISNEIDEKKSNEIDEYFRKQIDYAYVYFIEYIKKKKSNSIIIDENKNDKLKDMSEKTRIQIYLIKTQIYASKKYTMDKEIKKISYSIKKYINDAKNDIDIHDTIDNFKTLDDCFELLYFLWYCYTKHTNELPDIILLYKSLTDQTQKMKEIQNNENQMKEIQKILLIPIDTVVSYLENIKLKYIKIKITDEKIIKKCESKLKSRSKSRANKKSINKCIRNSIDNEIVNDFNMYIKSIDTNTNETNELLQKIEKAINDYYNLYIDDNQILYNNIISIQIIVIDNDELLNTYKTILYYLFYCYYMYTNEFPPKQFKNTTLSTIHEGSNEDNSKGGKIRRKTYKKSPRS